MAATQKLLSGMPLVLLKKKKLIRLWNSILPEPGQPSAQLSKLIRPTECRKTQHSMSRWHRTVHIPWLVDSYDTHKGKRWLNSNPQTIGPEPIQFSYPLNDVWNQNLWLHISNKFFANYWWDYISDGFYMMMIIIIINLFNILQILKIKKKL